MVRTERMRVQTDEKIEGLKILGFKYAKIETLRLVSSDRKFKSSYPDYFLNNLKVCQKKCPLTEILHKKIMKLFS